MKNEGIVSRIFRVIFSMLFLGIGAWAIYMAVKGETPAEPLDKPGDRIIISVFGAMFCTIGFMGTAYALLMGYRHAPSIIAGMATLAFVCFGLCFLAVAVLQPGEISSTSSVGGITVSSGKGGWGGAIAFGLFGIICLSLAPKVFTGYRKMLQKENQGVTVD